MVFRRALCTLLATAIALSSTAAALSFPQPTGYVNDFAGVIDSASRQSLEAAIVSIEQSSGAEIAVVTVPTLQNATVEEYAVKLFESWGIGKKSKDNGLLILVAPNEREWKVEVGYGLEGDLPDAKVSRIGRDCFTGNFTAGQYGAGLECAVASFGESITTTSTGLPYNIEYWQAILALVIFIILVIVTKGQILVWIWFIAKAFGFGGGRSGGGGGSGKW